MDRAASKRVKVKITIQQEAFQDTIVQQAFEVEYVVAISNARIAESHIPITRGGLLYK